VNLRKKKISTLAAFIAAAVHGGYVVAAQENSDDTSAVEEIVVTASYSGGLKKALDVKRNAPSIADAIIAEDIGKLPAVNVAEALQRVPGVTINREAGEGQFVSVRGLGPNFQSVTFNGSPIAFNENVRNSDQSGRQFRFNVIPADLIGGIVVTKSPTANIIDGGIGSNLDLETVNPLSKEPFLITRFHANHEQLSGEVSPNAAVSTGWKNSDETFGVMAGVSYQERDVRFERLQTFGYSNVKLNGQNARMVSELATTVEEEHRERASFLGGVEWRPIDNLSVSMDALYSKFDNEIAENRIFYSMGGTNTVVAAVDPNSVVIRNGVVTAAQIVNGGRISRNAEFSAQEHENSFVDLSMEYSVGDWQFEPSISYSEATSSLPTPLQRIESETLSSASVSYAFDLGTNPVNDARIEKLDSNLNLRDPAAVPFRRYRIRPIYSTDKDTTALFDISHELDLAFGDVQLTEFKTGLQYTERSRDYQRRDRNMEARSGVAVNGSFYDVALPSDVFSETIGVSDNGWVGPNFDKFQNAFIGSRAEFQSALVQPDALIPTNADLQNSYGIEEDVTALYGMQDFESMFFGVPLSGNLGVRWVKTETLVAGTIVTAGSTSSGGVTTIVTPTNFAGEYTELLPSLNLNFDLTDSVMLRIGITKALTRPSLADLRTAVVPNSSFVSDVFERGQTAINDTNGMPTGVGGNAQLKPYVATNFDTSVEWYFEDFGALSVSVFHKEIEDFIASVENVETLVFAVDPVKNKGVTNLPANILIARPRNVGDATVTGLELGYIDRLDMGLGLSSNITFVDASVDNNGKEQELQGVSDFSYSLTPFFESGPFEIHFSWTWRSEHNTSSNISIGTTAATDGQQFGADDFGSLDFGASYQFNDNAQVFIEGINITEERQAAFVGNDDVFLQAHSYGRTVNLGVKASF
jgi:iron complex outermembrane recepter protein